MGNSESQAVRNVDKRTARRDHAPKFKQAIARYRVEHTDEDGVVAAEQPRVDEAGRLGERLRVCVRRRPIFAHEEEAGEFDVLSCSRTSIVVHDGRLHPDCRHLFISHHVFGFDRVFDERASSADVYADAVAPLVRACVHERAPACVLMYGQTGSGKTFTTRGLLGLAAAQLFAEVGEGDEVSVAYAELAGLGMRDMLNGAAPCQLLTDRSGEVQVVPSLEVPVSDAPALLALVELCVALRATAATGVHDASSRSHAFCRIHVRRAGHPPGECGSLTLIDLAGSEQRIDTEAHTARRTKESAAINSSLMALKESVRALSRGEGWHTLAGGRHPLTQLLRPCFTQPHARSLVLATVSPSSKDTEHALNTLRHASLMDGRSDEGGTSWVGGGEVRRQDIGEIDIHGTQAKRRAEAEALATRRDGAPRGGGGGADDSIGASAAQASERRREARADAAAFKRAERQAMRALKAAAPEQLDALLAERERASAGPSLNRFQAARLTSRAANGPWPGGSGGGLAHARAEAGGRAAAREVPPPGADDEPDEWAPGPPGRVPRAPPPKHAPRRGSSVDIATDAAALCEPGGGSAEDEDDWTGLAAAGATDTRRRGADARATRPPVDPAERRAGPSAASRRAHAAAAAAADASSAAAAGFRHADADQSEHWGAGGGGGWGGSGGGGWGGGRERGGPRSEAHASAAAGLGFGAAAATRASTAVARFGRRATPPTSGDSAHGGADWGDAGGAESGTELDGSDEGAWWHGARRAAGDSRPPSRPPSGLSSRERAAAHGRRAAAASAGASGADTPRAGCGGGAGSVGTSRGGTPRGGGGGAAAGRPPPAPVAAPRHAAAPLPASPSAAAAAAAAAADPVSPGSSQIQSRLEAARARREALERARREQLLRRQGSSGGSGGALAAAGPASAAAGGADETSMAAATAPPDHRAELARLQAAIDALPRTRVHDAARAGLTRQRDVHRAALLRERRRAEQASRAAAAGHVPASAAAAGGVSGAPSGTPSAPAREPDAEPRARSPLGPLNGAADLAREPSPARAPLSAADATAPSRSGVRKPTRRVVRDFDAAESDEVSVRVDDHVDVLADDGDSAWVEVRHMRTDELGLLPRECIAGL